MAPAALGPQAADHPVFERRPRRVRVADLEHEDLGRREGGAEGVEGGAEGGGGGGRRRREPGGRGGVRVRAAEVLEGV